MLPLAIYKTWEAIIVFKLTLGLVVLLGMMHVPAKSNVTFPLASSSIVRVAEIPEPTLPVWPGITVERLSIEEQGKVLAGIDVLEMNDPTQASWLRAKFYAGKIVKIKSPDGQPAAHGVNDGDFIGLGLAWTAPTEVAGVLIHEITHINHVGSGGGSTSHKPCAGLVDGQQKDECNRDAHRNEAIVSGAAATVMCTLSCNLSQDKDHQYGLPCEQLKHGYNKAIDEWRNAIHAASGDTAFDEAAEVFLLDLISKRNDIEDECCCEKD